MAKLNIQIYYILCRKFIYYGFIQDGGNNNLT